MPTTLAFDIYGTLFDTDGVKTALEKLVGERAADFARAWRDRQLEYSFRRGLMRDYVDFGVCTRQALDQVCLAFGVVIPDQAKSGLLAVYRSLPVFGDVAEGLKSLAGKGYRLYAFSNGRAEMVRALLVNSKIDGYFLGVVSVDEVGSFKPDPEVYRHFLKKTGSAGADSWLISANPFDVLGAMAAGMNGLWLKRSPAAIFDPWGVEPTVTVRKLTEVAGMLPLHRG